MLHSIFIVVTVTSLVANCAILNGDLDNNLSPPLAGLSYHTGYGNDIPSSPLNSDLSSQFPSQSFSAGGGLGGFNSPFDNSGPGTNFNPSTSSLPIASGSISIGGNSFGPTNNAGGLGPINNNGGGLIGHANGPGVVDGGTTYDHRFERVPVPQPVPVPVTVTRPVHVPVPVPKRVEVPRPVPVDVPTPVHVEVKRPVPVPVPRPYPVHVKTPVYVKVPTPVHVNVPKPYPVLIARPYPVDVPVKVAVKIPVPVDVHSVGPVGVHGSSAIVKLKSYSHDSHGGW